MCNKGCVKPKETAPNLRKGGLNWLERQVMGLKSHVDWDTHKIAMGTYPNQSSTGPHRMVNPITWLVYGSSG